MHCWSTVSLLILVHGGRVACVPVPVILEAECCAPVDEAGEPGLEERETGEEQQLTAPHSQQGHQVLQLYTNSDRKFITLHTTNLLFLQ